MKRKSPRGEQDLLQEMRRRLRFWLLVLLTIAGAGVVGYHAIDHCSWLQAAYQTVCVLSTLGQTSPPVNAYSKAFTIVLAIAGISSFAYAAGAIVQGIASEEYHRAVERGKVLRRMKKMSNHHIICGYGRISGIVIEHLRAQNLAYAVIERDSETFRQMEELGILGLLGDASHEEVLGQAGLERASAVIVATASDAENLLITMTARQLNPTIPIIVRCDEEANTPKFIKVGATRVITLNTSGASQIALAATKPYVIDLIDLATGTGNQEFQLRQLLVPDGSPVHGQTLRDLAFGSRFGVIVIGIKSRGQEMQFNPSANAQIAAGDMLITVGREEQFKQIESFLAGLAK